VQINARDFPIIDLLHQFSVDAVHEWNEVHREFDHSLIEVQAGFDPSHLKQVNSYAESIRSGIRYGSRLMPLNRGDLENKLRVRVINY